MGLGIGFSSRSAPPATQVAPCSAKPRSVTPPRRDDGGFGGCGFLGGGGAGAAPPESGRCPAGELAREPPAGEAGALEEAQMARRGSGSPGLGPGQGSGYERVRAEPVSVGGRVRGRVCKGWGQLPLPLPLPLTSRGSGSPVGERAGRPAAVRASARKSAGREHAPSQKGETAAGPLSTWLGSELGSGSGSGSGLGLGLGLGWG